LRNPSATPIRAILRRQANASVIMGRVDGIDRQARQVILETGRRLDYDWLILATGVRHTYFGHDDWEGHAPGLKKISDAIAIHHKVLKAFEDAENATTMAERQRLLTFCVVGGGPTGVELAGTIAELAHKALARDFRSIDPISTRVLLIEAGPCILPSFPLELSGAAERQLASLDVEVLTGKAVTACGADGIEVAGRGPVATATVLWVAGVMASPAARWLGAFADRAGRVQVTDAARLSVPGVAPAAKQMGRYAGQTICVALAGRPRPRPFRYRDWGNLATIGRKAAVADFGRLRLKGLSAWLEWSLAHVFFLIGFRNRAIVLLDWTMSYFTFSRGARLISD
jgi:NADH dehydrogenase